MYGFGGVGLSEVQISISELSVVGGGGWVVVGGLDKRTSWSDLVGVRQKTAIYNLTYMQLQTFDLRALEGSFCRKFGWGAVYFSMTGMDKFANNWYQS